MVYLASQEFLRFVESEGLPQVQEVVTEPESEQEYEPAKSLRGSYFHGAFWVVMSCHVVHK